MEKTPKPRWYDKTIIWLLYSLAVGLPLIFSTAFYSNFAEPKLLFLRIVTLAVLLLWVWKSFNEGRITYRRGKIGWMLLILAAVLLLSTLSSINIFTSLFGGETRFLGLFTMWNLLLVSWLVYNFLTTQKQLRTFVILLCGTGIVILMIYGFLQYFGLFKDAFDWSQNPQERVFGTFGHSDNFGAYMGMCLLLSFAAVPLLKNKILKSLFILCAFLAFVVILLTGSRTATAATLISLVIVLGITLYKNHEALLKKYWWKAGLVILCILGLAAVFSQDLSKIPVIQRFEQASNVQGYPIDRISWWESSFAMFEDKPIIGFGLSTFRDIYNGYRRLDYRVPGPGDMQDQITPESSHNDYVDILVTEGLLGLAVFLAFLGIIFMALDKKIFSHGEPDEFYYLSLGIKGAIMVYLFQAIFNFGVIDTLSIFYILIGAGVSAASREEGVKHIPLPQVVKEVFAGAFLILIMVAGFGTIQEASAEYSYRSATIDEALGATGPAESWYQQMISEQPYRYEYYEAYADFAFKTAVASADNNYATQYLQIALENYQKAILLNHFHPNTFYNMGITSIQLSNKEQSDFYLDQGVNDLKQAIALSPNNPLYSYEAAKIFQEIGQKDLAISALSYVVEIAPDYMDAAQRLNALHKQS